MKSRIYLPIAYTTLIFLTGCISFVQNGLRGYETQKLAPVIIDGRSFNVEKRTRLIDINEPPKGTNITIAVYAEVNGKLVYCGAEPFGCKQAIIKELSTSGFSEFEGGD